MFSLTEIVLLSSNDHRKNQLYPGTVVVARLEVTKSLKPAIELFMTAMNNADNFYRFFFQA